jgi:hypothetical protein
MGDATFDSAVCEAPCTEDPVDTPSCSDFDQGGPVDCWESAFTPPSKNRLDAFSDKIP